MNTYRSKLSAIIEESAIAGIKSTPSKNEIGPLEFSMLADGQYLCTSDGLFTKELTQVRIQPSDGSSTPAYGQFFAHVVDQNTISIYSLDVNTDNSVPADFRFLDFEINNL